MRRRELLLIATAMLGTRTVRAQQTAIPIIGWLSSLSPDRAEPFLAAFRQGLRETGYVEGHNVTVEYRWAEGNYDRLPTLAVELVGRRLDVIATSVGSLRRSRQKKRPRQFRLFPSSAQIQ
jgi:putative ABC transport system substrate-binding protein